MRLRMTVRHARWLGIAALTGTMMQTATCDLSQMMSSQDTSTIVQTLVTFWVDFARQALAAALF